MEKTIFHAIKEPKFPPELNHLCYSEVELMELNVGIFMNFTGNMEIKLYGNFIATLMVKVGGCYSLY